MHWNHRCGFRLPNNRLHLHEADNGGDDVPDASDDDDGDDEASHHTNSPDHTNYGNTMVNAIPNLKSS